MILHITLVMGMCAVSPYTHAMDGSTPPSDKPTPDTALSSHVLAAKCAAQAKRITKTTEKLASRVASLVEHAHLLKEQLSADEEAHEEKASEQEISLANGLLRSLLSPAHVALSQSAARLEELSHDVRITALKLGSASYSPLPPMMTGSTPPENRQVPYAEHSATESNSSSDHDNTLSDESLPQIMMGSTPPASLHVPYAEHSATEHNNDSDHDHDSDDDMLSESFLHLININSNHYTVLNTEVTFHISISAINTVPLPESSAVTQLTHQRRNSI